MSMRSITAYDEMLEFVTSKPSLEQIIAFTPSERTWKRLSYLQRAQRQGTLKPDEQAELDEFMKIERFLDKLKLRAQRRVEN